MGAAGRRYWGKVAGLLIARRVLRADDLEALEHVGDAEGIDGDVAVALLGEELLDGAGLGLGLGDDGHADLVAIGRAHADLSDGALAASGAPPPAALVGGLGGAGRASGLGRGNDGLGGIGQAAEGGGRGSVAGGDVQGAHSRFILGGRGGVGRGRVLV
jgi:hypothetical protein